MIMKAVKPQYFKKPYKSERSELLWAFFVYAPWILCHHFLSDMAKKKSTEKSFPSVDCSFASTAAKRRKRNTQGHSSSFFSSPQQQQDLDKLCFCSTRGLSCPEWRWLCCGVAQSREDMEASHFRS